MRGRPALAPDSRPGSMHAETDDTAGGILPSVGANAAEPPAPYPTSFAHIVDLVTSGKPIPGIKDVPNTVLTGQGSQNAKAQRRKPWETNVSRRIDSDEIMPSAVPS